MILTSFSTLLFSASVAHNNTIITHLKYTSIIRPPLYNSHLVLSQGRPLYRLCTGHCYIDMHKQDDTYLSISDFVSCNSCHCLSMSITAFSLQCSSLKRQLIHQSPILSYLNFAKFNSFCVHINTGYVVYSTTNQSHSSEMPSPVRTGVILCQMLILKTVVPLHDQKTVRRTRNSISTFLRLLNFLPLHDDDVSLPHFLF